LGKRFLNWLSKASSLGTQKQWKSRWMKFAKWVVSSENPLTGKSYMACTIDEVDDLIRKDFETMPSHLFQDKYKDILTKYVASLSELKANTALGLISSVRSFFTNECASIKLPNGKIPKSEMASNEHRFNLNEFRNMWLVADTEGKARLSVAVSLGWSVGEFLSLKAKFCRDVLRNVDDDGFAAFDFRRKKTGARIRGILNPNAVKDLEAYLKRIPDDQEWLWTTKTDAGINYWFRSLCKEAGIKENGSIRFHLIRKYVFDVAVAQCGIYEAKLLTGKKIPISDSTYLHGLEDRLLERYKKFAYPFLKLKLNGELVDQGGRMEELAEKVDSLSIEAEEWKTTAIKMKKENREITERMDRVVLDLKIFKNYAVNVSEISRQVLLDNYYLIKRLGDATGKSYDEIVTESMTEKQRSDYFKTSKLSDEGLPSKLEELDKILRDEWGKSGLEQIKQVEEEANRIVKKVSSAKKERIRRKN
jgi:hypothetical protein